MHWVHSEVILGIWQVMPRDRRVAAFPKDVLLRHECEKLAVAIEKGGIGHYYLIRDESIIIK